MMPPCMVCGKTGVRLFRVEKNYGTVNRTVRDDLVEIFGERVVSYLHEDDYVCNMCMNMLDNFAKLRRRLWPLISRPREERKPIKLGRIWSMFASLKIEEDELDAEIPETTLTPSQTPASLLTLNYSEPYSSKTEALIERREYCKSRASSIYARSDITDSSEIQRMYRRRRKRGHGWARKKGKSNNSSAEPSEYSSYSYRSSLSGSSKTSSKRRSNDSSKREVEYDAHGRLVQKRTRSVSRVQEEEKKVLERIEENKLYCDEKDCQFYFQDVEVITFHKITDHFVIPLFVCNECDNRYTSKEHLRIHSQQHDFLPFFCLMCQDELPNAMELQKHLDQHLVYSVPCKFCDRSFLNRNLTERHITLVHRDKRKRRIVRDKLILARIDNSDIESDDEDSNKTCVPKRLEVFFAFYTDMIREEDDLDISEENFRKLNITFYSGEDMAEVHDNEDEVDLTENEELLVNEENISDLNIEETSVHILSDSIDNVSDILSIINEEENIEINIVTDFEMTGNVSNKESSNLNDENSIINSDIVQNVSSPEEDNVAHLS